MKNVANVLSHINETQNIADIIKLLKQNNCLKFTQHVLYSDYQFNFCNLYLKYYPSQKEQKMKYKFISKYPLTIKTIQDVLTNRLYNKIYSLVNNTAVIDTNEYGLPKDLKTSHGVAPMIIGWTMKYYGFNWIIQRIIKKSKKGFPFMKCPTIKLVNGKVNSHSYPYFAYYNNEPVSVENIADTIEDLLLNAYDKNYGC